LRLESHSERRKPWSGSEKSEFALSETAEKLLFNIGCILRNHTNRFCMPQTANLAAGQKRGLPERLRSSAYANKLLKRIDIF
jgi:hypothetical protein